MSLLGCNQRNLDPVHMGPDPYGHHINLKSLKTSTTLKFVIILQNLIKAYHRKSGKSKYDRKLTELVVETRRSRMNGVLLYSRETAYAQQSCYKSVLLLGLYVKMKINTFGFFDTISLKT